MSNIITLFKKNKDLKIFFTVLWGFEFDIIIFLLKLLSVLEYLSTYLPTYLSIICNIIHLSMVNILKMISINSRKHNILPNYYYSLRNISLRKLLLFLFFPIHICLCSRKVKYTSLWKKQTRMYLLFSVLFYSKCKQNTLFVSHWISTVS